MTAASWIELGTFWLLTLSALALLILIADRLRCRAGSTMTRRAYLASRLWQQTPEVRLTALALPLELLWEVAQFPLYDVWHIGDWGYILYGLAHCTLGDLAIVLAVYSGIALLTADRRWYRTHLTSRAVAYTLLGAAYTIFSEIYHVRVEATWGYTPLMPIVPGTGIGATPLLQWILIPPLLLWLLRMVSVREPAAEDTGC